MACKVTTDKCQWKKIKGQRLGLFQGRSQQQWLTTELIGDGFLLLIPQWEARSVFPEDIWMSSRVRNSCFSSFPIFTCLWCACTRVEGQGWWPASILIGFHMIHRDRVTQENPELANMDSLNSQFALRTTSTPSQTGITGQCLHPPSVYVDSGNLNSGLPICTAKS